MGQFRVPSDSARKEVDELLAFEQKRAAIESVFTMALLYVATLQVWWLFDQRLWLAAPIFVGFVVALLLGGRNLVSQIWNVVIGVWSKLGGAKNWVFGRATEN